MKTCHRYIFRGAFLFFGILNFAASIPTIFFLHFVFLFCFCKILIFNGLEWIQAFAHVHGPQMALSCLMSFSVIDYWSLQRSWSGIKLHIIRLYGQILDKKDKP